MFRFMGFIKARDGMSQDEFKSYYESKHYPLMQRLLPMVHEVKRNYLDFTDPATAQIAKELGVNVIVEASFNSKEDYLAFSRAFEAQKAEILADEAHFVGGKRRFMVEQYRSKS